MSLSLIPAKKVKTERLTVSYLEKGTKANPVLILVHGNVSSNLFWTDAVNFLSEHYHVLAPDLRGYGETEVLPIDATKGLSEWAEDLKSFVDALDLSKPFSLLGWSLGGGIIMQYGISYPEDLKSLILLNPISPYGFSGTKDEKGTPCNENYSGTGAGGANPEFVKLLKEQDRSANSPGGPLNVMNQLYFKPPFTVDKETEELFLTSMFTTKVDEGFYPGDFTICQEWPGVGPGVKGINNAFSPKYMNLQSFASITPKVPVLWIRGENDLIVSDQSMLDFGFLGQLGFVPGWPGAEIYPPQPMIKQTRYVLDMYQKNGGFYEEVVISDCGHSPQIEKPEKFYEKVIEFVSKIK